MQRKGFSLLPRAEYAEQERHQRKTLARGAGRKTLCVQAENGAIYIHKKSPSVKERNFHPGEGVRRWKRRAVSLL